VQILCDPWLEEGAYYGSWCHYPPLEFGPEDFNHVDYIYISHIHPDHCDLNTLSSLDKDIPVLIHDYRWDYLRDTIEGLGFDVIELPNNTRTHLTGNLHINIVAADNCDPELCGNFFGCDWFDDDRESSGSTQVDSFAVIDDGEFVVVDTNDCPFQMAQVGLRNVKDQYGNVDALLHQYTGAQFYPQRMIDYTHSEKIAERDRVIQEKFEYAERFLDLLEPEYHLPIAGQYFLSGRLAHLNRYTAIPERKEALEYFTKQVDGQHECVFLNGGESIDLETGRRSSPFDPVDIEERRQYIIHTLASREFDYESEPIPEFEDLQELVPDAYDRFENRRRTIGYETDTDVFVSLVGSKYLKISVEGDGYEYVTDPPFETLSGYVRMEVDPRLLTWILRGPSNAHWADAKIGSHIGIGKSPDIYERGLYNCMSDFYA
jgi:UDP-MurNAc hydroxylase